jgi:hypothetical protein
VERSARGGGAAAAARGARGGGGEQGGEPLLGGGRAEQATAKYPNRGLGSLGFILHPQNILRKWQNAHGRCLAKWPSEMPTQQAV